MAETPVTTKDGLIRVIFELMDDYDAVGDQWENKDIYSFLQAMAAWLNDAAGYYRNTGANVDAETPSAARPGAPPRAVQHKGFGELRMDVGRETKVGIFRAVQHKGFGELRPG